MSSYFYNNSFSDNMSNYAEVDNTSSLMNEILQTDLVKKKPEKEIKLTHKDCILLYKNPNIGSESKYNHALKHIKNCKTCKHEISKNKEVIEEIKIIKPSESFQPVYSPPDNEYKKIMQDEKNVQHQNILIEQTIAKYFDTIEEKKKLNENIEKIKESITNTHSDKPLLFGLIFFFIILVIIDIFLRIHLKV